jgi:sulfate permease, SulP family
MDSTAANTIYGTGRQAARNGMKLFITGAFPPVRRVLLRHGVRPPLAKYRSSIDKALQDIREGAGQGTETATSR